jgi:pimeloyl-ACP methyl ester carboxylesterase
MKYKNHCLAALLVALLALSFIGGLMVGGRRLPPYSWLETCYRQHVLRQYDRYERFHSFYRETDVRSLISIRDESDVMEKRDELILYIWKDGGFPYARLPDGVEEGVKDDRYSALANLERIDKIVVSMEHGVDSVVYHFRPARSTRGLVMYHEGHGGDFVLGKDAIQFFLEEGYSVMAFSMPLMGMNSRPKVDFPSLGRLQLAKHEYLKFLESENFSPIKFFVEPVAAVLNYAEKNLDFRSVAMVGISGGGWTATLYAALDPRVSKSYPVAGSLPLYMSHITCTGEYEQYLPDLYRAANYLELYVLGSHGEDRRQLQVLNRYDFVCLAGDAYQTYEEEEKRVMARLGKGRFDVYLDDSHKGHKISGHALGVILDDLEGR